MADQALSRPIAAEEPRRRGRRIGSFVLPIYTALVVGYLMLPIVVMIVFGFNDTQGRFNFTWNGFTLEHYRNIFTSQPRMNEALINRIGASVPPEVPDPSASHQATSLPRASAATVPMASRALRTSSMAP